MSAIPIDNCIWFLEGVLMQRWALSISGAAILDAIVGYLKELKQIKEVK